MVEEANHIVGQATDVTVSGYILPCLVVTLIAQNGNLCC